MGDLVFMHELKEMKHSGHNTTFFINVLSPRFPCDKQVNILNSFDNRLASLETSVLPIHKSTQSLTRLAGSKCQNDSFRNERKRTWQRYLLNACDIQAFIIPFFPPSL